jgi:hypothetical protein
MTMKIVGLMAVLGAISMPVFADEGSQAQEDAFRPRPPFERQVTCFAQNVLGRTFAVRGDFRAPRGFLERRAVQDCRRESLPFISRTCRPAGCRG